eukprot:CAMPEP_0175125364 /NCGR_PEP_ID=MMETSP0087-20121206/3277_1 /TAXON_ID=136419 /ORGANISM="Unknown Unknown, Strain D1" /LENGTH=87 /DNA_ID=CAMNT_0016407197 /DNA_START=282 /DNA_END=545 /DNA_ORIENTATION=-
MRKSVLPVYNDAVNRHYDARHQAQAASEMMTQMYAKERQQDGDMLNMIKCFNTKLEAQQEEINQSWTKTGHMSRRRRSGSLIASNQV